MKVLVTGATGLVGWHTAARLCAAGHRVRALVRDGDKGRRVLVPAGVDAADLVVGDMGDEASVERALADCDAVVHAAAAVSLDAHHADEQLRTNVEGVRLVIGGACRKDVEAIHVSSLTALFDSRAAVITADSRLAVTRSAYGRSKSESDRLVRGLQEQGAPVAIVYPGAVIGPDDPGFSQSVRAFRSFLKTTLRSSGGVQFIDARDLAEFLLRLLEGRVRGRHVAAGHFLSWDELAHLLEQVSGAPVHRFGAPGVLLRALGRVIDVANRFVKTDAIMTGEAMDLATLWRPIENSPALGELGITLRDPAETIEATLRSLLSAGRLPARALPRLVEAPTVPSSARSF